MKIVDMIKRTLNYRLHRQYVISLLDVVSRALVGASKVDERIQQEIAQFPVGFRFAMTVFGTDLGFCLQVTEQKCLSVVSPTAEQQPVDVKICFKHLRYAFLVLSFQESTAQAFAHDRMFVNGDLSSAIRLVRCLNQLEAVILPKFIARLAVKEYPNQLTLSQKLNLSQQIYRKVIQSYFQGKQH